MTTNDVATIGMVDWGSNVVNGALVGQPPTSAFFPVTFGTEFTGPKWPSQGTYQIPPVTPSAAMANNQVSPSPSGLNTGPNANAATAQQTAAAGSSANPWHPTQGTIVFGFGALILGLFMLHYIHYGAG